MFGCPLGVQSIPEMRGIGGNGHQQPDIAKYNTPAHLHCFQRVATLSLRAFALQRPGVRLSSGPFLSQGIKVKWASPRLKFLFQMVDEDSPNLSFASIEWYWDSPADHLEINERQGQVHPDFQ
jgi:hypothetical protein